ncbi:HU family DNA-binding protein [Bacillus paranthracis]|uniref:HU family DNA-binding protein n=1 Tax=Bacillus paranthracis TaxID=2026186 RepID=UPI00187A61C3|nr:HU family DNA-binding protein [Bacillus paranthracis]
MGLAKRVKYTDLIQYVADRCGVSYHKSHRIIKELSKVLKESISRGDTIHCEGLFTISFTYKRGSIYRNRVFGIQEQVNEVMHQLGGLQEVEVIEVVKVYYRRMHDLVGQGYQVNVKGIGYVIPREGENKVYCDTRVSPVLDKPDMADFLVLKDSGELILEQVEKKDLRFDIQLDEKANVPYMVMKEREFRFETVEI